MSLLNHVRSVRTQPTRGPSRLVAVSIALGIVACHDIIPPSTRRADDRPLAPSTASASRLPDRGAIVLRGAIVTPGGVINQGYVGIVNDRIVSVSDKQPNIAGAISINTEGIIVPGFVDVHNHLPWNVLPRWTPPHLYANRSQWRSDPVFIQQVRSHFDNLIGDGDATGTGNICDMSAYSEMRALVGGVTSILATHPVPCIHGLVRNLDYNSGFYGTTELDRERVVSAIEIPPASDGAGRAQFVAVAHFAIENPSFEGLFLHVSEGLDAFSLEEFTFGQSQGLLCSKCVAIHGVALGAPQFQAMAHSGTSLVWSPRSNVNLYGRTADINAALDAGVRVALAPDWAISGSGNMMEELHFADRWNRTHLNGRLTDRQLVDMVTSIPAQEAGIDDEVGAIRSGLRADLLVIHGKHDHALRAVIDATPDDVELVMIGGVALYGDRNTMERFWPHTGLEEINGPDGHKTLASSAAGFTFSSVVTRLVHALTADGTTLAPLIEERAHKPGKDH